MNRMRLSKKKQWHRWLPLKSLNRMELFMNGDSEIG